MAKIRKLKIRWNSSPSPHVVCYKLYWSVGGRVGYESEHAEVGKNTEVTLPDDVTSFPFIEGIVEFGVTAVTETGNESDMTTLMTPLQFTAPEAPIELAAESLLDFWFSSNPFH